MSEAWRAAAMHEIGKCWVMFPDDDISTAVCSAHEGGGWRTEAERDSSPCAVAAWMLKAAEAAVEADRAQRAELLADEEDVVVCPSCLTASLRAPDHLDC